MPIEFEGDWIVKTPKPFSKRKITGYPLTVTKRKGVRALLALGLAEGNYRYDATAERTEIMWKCLDCGELKPRTRWVLGPCPSCGAPKSQFVLVDED
jgi:hypothetical protein